MGSIVEIVVCFLSVRCNTDRLVVPIDFPGQRCQGLAFAD